MELRTHDRYDYVPLRGRADYTWPAGRRLAVYFALNLEHFSYGEGLGAELAPGGPHPDILNYAWRDYGNRVGAWYMLDAFDALRLPMAALVNSAMYDYAPELVAACRARGDEIVGHGRTNAERQGVLGEADERALIAEATSASVAPDATVTSICDRLASAVKAPAAMEPKRKVSVPDPTVAVAGLTVGVVRVWPLASWVTSSDSVPLPVTLPLVTVATVLLAITGVTARSPVRTRSPIEVASEPIMFLSVLAADILVVSLSFLALNWSSRDANCAVESCSARLAELIPLPAPSVLSNCAVAEPDEVAETAVELVVDEVVAISGRTTAAPES